MPLLPLARPRRRRPLADRLLGPAEARVRASRARRTASRSASPGQAPRHAETATDGRLACARAPRGRRCPAARRAPGRGRPRAARPAAAHRRGGAGGSRTGTCRRGRGRGARLVRLTLRRPARRGRLDRADRHRTAARCSTADRGDHEHLGGGRLGGEDPEPGGRAADAGAGRGSAAAAAERAQDGVAHRQGRHDRQDRRQRRPLGAHARGVRGALVALREVIAQVPAAQRRSGRDGKLLADRVARDRARVRRRHQVLARLEDQRLDLPRPHADHLAHLGMREVAELGEQQRRALVVGQRAQIVEQVAQIGALLDVGGEVLGRRHARVRKVVLLAPRAQERDAAIARDRVQPRPHGLGHLAGAERAVGGDERVLDDVLGVVDAPDHVAGEREQLQVVALEERLEGGHVATARRARELLVVRCPTSR